MVLVCRNSTDTAYFQRLRPYPRIMLRRMKCLFKDYDKTPIGFGVVVFCIAKSDCRCELCPTSFSSELLLTRHTEVAVQFCWEAPWPECAAQQPESAPSQLAIPFPLCLPILPSPFSFPPLSPSLPPQASMWLLSYMTAAAWPRSICLCKHLIRGRILL